MKRLKIAVIALFALIATSNVNAQDENNPWVVGFGMNIVDFYGGDDFGDHVKDLFGSSDWNYVSSISRVSVEKYLEKGFTLQIAGTLNRITFDQVRDDSDFFYYSIGAAVKYDLNNLVGETSQWFDPYVYLGGDYVSANSTQEGMINLGVGFNTWFSDNLGLNFQTGTKKGFSDNVKTHYQTSLGLVVKFGGKDTDGDGVYDKKDACPEVAGLIEFNGCPDADGDGIKDSDDACPNVAGLAAMNGCPDADGDGVADKDDMCPNAKGTKANKGCPDSDGDGLVDKDDKCATIAGPSANGGCPWPDTDGDGVLDKDDNCKTEVGPASNNGCPEPVITEAAKMGVDTFAKAILFNTGRASFKSGVSKQIDGMLAIMNEFPKAEFDIKGYTDSTGSASNNLKLSEKRANAVRNYLISKGIAASRLIAKGYGEDAPIDSNKTRAGRSNNRRVEVKVSN
ncbi:MULTISPECIES: OmpA family protein [unclassified Polaribacter]|jgi:outer membrane protein OmpA-like peptidoglycan-associated protein|uniref:OmpA family protein n=1 Tax=unclassified Polaribacter TaxID=196858 RepID=UPI00052B6371|nr:MULTISPECIES: OmpA family protein [unclassified Polaribacter]KGL59389.1 OmpA family protein [Polaribacter sp. Hel1_33_49]PKV63869.1 outer membrane protein OmpA-like peptidoglycan-associated protein [Polaribacter sp. Hel1_33_96]